MFCLIRFVPGKSCFLLNVVGIGTRVGGFYLPAACNQSRQSHAHVNMFHNVSLFLTFIFAGNFSF